MAVAHGGNRDDQASLGGRWAREVLRRRLDEPGADPQIVQQWIRTYAEAKLLQRAVRDVDELVENKPLWRSAACELLESLATSKPPQQALAQSFVRSHHADLQGDAGAWGAAGYALSTVGLNRPAVKWLADWRTRPGIQPWMLSNLAASLYRLNRDAEAVEVHRRGTGA